MKIDMHCHVKEGSIDSKVSLEDYITLLKKKGFQGMVITDHNTYNGYRYWKNHMKGKVHTDFVVLKGIEYDTRDAGHILVIMPEGVKMRLLEMRGMPVSLLIDLVHRNGGVLGPAHPCGEKVTTGGSDSHKTGCVGRAYTILPEPVTCETELISMIHKKVPFEVGGVQYEKTTKDRIGKVNKVLVYSFWLYNKGGELIKRRGRKVKMEEEHPIDPIDPIELYYTGKS